VASDFVLYRAPTPLGFFAILRNNNWLRHVLRHPELDGHLADIQTVLTEPDFIVEAGDGSHHFYRAGLGTGRWPTVFFML
jgi:hypothetical protein